MATLTIARPQTVLQVLKKALNVLAECNVIYEAVPVKKPRTCILPAPRLAECFPESRVLQVLCQRAHRHCIVAPIMLRCRWPSTSRTRSRLSQRLLGSPLRCGSCRLSGSHEIERVEVIAAVYSPRTSRASTARVRNCLWRGRRSRVIRSGLYKNRRPGRSLQRS